jgi:cobaltochelatase CobN
MRDVEANIVGSEPDGRRMPLPPAGRQLGKVAQAAPADRRVALIMANYPNRDGRLGNGVGLDTPAGTIEVMKAMRRRRLCGRRSPPMAMR